MAMQPLIHPEHMKRDFLKYTAQKIKHDLKNNHPAVLSRFCLMLMTGITSFGNEEY